jgi:hypothetical protein
VTTASLSRVADFLDPLPQQTMVDWIGDKLREYVWSKQCAVCESVERHRFTAVPSCHGAGKSFIASRISAAWLDIHPQGEAFVVTSAPTDKQVKAILWREMGRAHRKGKLAGRINLDAEWFIGPELVAYGRKPQDLTDPNEAMQAFQGIHAKYVLVVLDEAGGVPEWLWTAAESLVTNEHSRILAIGNPDDPSSHFEQACRPGEGYNVINISAFDLPWATGEQVPEALKDLLTGEIWVNERKKRWGEESPFYISKVLGQFPEIGDDTLITPAMVRAAMEYESENSLDLGQMGGDIARLGKDRTVVYHNRGGQVRKVYEKHKQTTEKTTGGFLNLIKKFWNRVPMNVDVIGLGAGVFDRLKEQGANVHPFNASERAYDPTKFKNRRAEGWWVLREWFEEGLIDIDPADEDLAGQLTNIKFWYDSSGRVQIESKEELAKRGLPSPDHADACMMAFVKPAEMFVPDEEELAEDLTGDLLEMPM